MEQKGILKNKQGFTVVELTVAFSLTLVVVLLLFQIIINLKDLYVKDGIKTELLIKQGLITKKVAESFEEKKIRVATKCTTGDNCLSFTFEDNTVKTLSFDKEDNVFHYGDYTTKLISGSNYGEVKVTNETFLNVEEGKKDSMITINIPIEHELVEGDYGIRVVYLYNSMEASVGDLNLSEATTTEQVFLKGNSVMVLKDESYTEPGYYVRKKDGTILENDSRVKVTGTVGTTSGTYSIVYSLVVNNVVISQKRRQVSIVNTNNNFGFLAEARTFTTPVTGNYKIELWGAAGGSAYYNRDGSGDLIEGGRGAYTTGIITLDAGDILYVYTGRIGRNGTADTVSQATFNGGGTGGSKYQGGASGGGATDIRLINGYWNDDKSLRSRIMVAGGGGGASNWTNATTGGYAGGLTGSSGILNSGSVSHTTATGGSQTAGGKGAVGTVSGGAGTFGIGGNSYPSYGGGGGGGYYGGGAGSYLSSGVSSGAGGSSFISGHDGCNAINADGTHNNTAIHYSKRVFTDTSIIAGNKTMPNPRASGSVVGNPGNGYAKITLVSILS